jgi:hypothetical protein
MTQKRKGGRKEGRGERRRTERREDRRKQEKGEVHTWQTIKIAIHVRPCEMATREVWWEVQQCGEKYSSVVRSVYFWRVRYMGHE